MKKQYLTCLLVTILTVGLVFTACDLLAGGTGATTPPETFDPLVIRGKDSDGNPVIVKFSRPTSKAALTPSTLKNEDTYEIFHNGVLVSSGTIEISGGTVTFTPATGNQFLGTVGSSGGVSTLTLPNGVIPTSTGGTITGFVPDGGSNGGNSSSDALAVEALFNSSYAKASGSTVVISGPVTVAKSINIPSGVKLIFSADDNDEFRINNNTISVTARGGIEVSSGKGISVTGAGALVVEGNSTIYGRLNIGKKGVDTGALDISGSGTEFTIADGGVLSLLGEATVAKVAKEQYNKDNIKEGWDAVLKGSGTLIVKNGGRFYMPDPSQFDVSNITGVIRVESGGELIAITANLMGMGNGSSKGVEDLHPVIGILSTATEGVPIGADYVMDPATYPKSKIEARISHGIPVFELTGNATALGSLVLKYDEDVNVKQTPYRNDVWVTSPFTVTDNSELMVGISKDEYLSSTLLVTGSDDSFLPGKRNGVLINNGTIRIYDGCGIVQWLGGYFNYNAGSRARVYPRTGTGAIIPESCKATWGVGTPPLIGNISITIWRSENTWFPTTSGFNYVP